MYVVTGGAGFIGSNIVATLEDAGHDVVVVDWLGSDPFKWRNLAKRNLLDLITPEEAPAFLARKADAIEGIVHMGAISTTTETDVDLIVRSNQRLSMDLWDFCAAAAVPLVYASSAATYGDGAQGFEDSADEAFLAGLRPLNPYGWSKHAFDRWVMKRLARGQSAPPRWAGLKFFNVFGPNEYHKGGQRSVAVQVFEQINSTGKVRLFKSDRPDYRDGEQLRDFVWVGDCVDIAVQALTDPNFVSGLYNVGSGTPRSFREVAEIIFGLLDRPIDIDYIDMPQALLGKYQYYTCATLEKLRAGGYTKPTTGLEAGLKAYVDFLAGPDGYR
jgi:ADP-L-glycero-D-manno-heptose 6-epimerase